MSDYQFILDHLPYSGPFLFVDDILKADDTGVIGEYTFPEDSYFYQGHFANYAITPGVILIETMAQIGLVCLGIHLMKSAEGEMDAPRFAMTSSEVSFYLPVYPGEKVTVYSEKVYFRFGKLKCKVEMLNEGNEVICDGILSGMIVKTN
ncbi:MAG: 3-hydroxyacyl-ACP dehydratase FabZ family protein [Saprospiraceae bacterium]|nr:beta-hydroxyacyl-ACP dehydratase [Saprospiraceae bacterium]MBP7643820.1 beta-hydroxyacyl-ACP dehydratase [Saprospiraceae bacterium]